MKRKIIIASIAIFLVIAGVTAFFLWTRKVEVPNLVNKSYDIVEAELAEEGYKITVTEEYSLTVPKGDIISQSVQAGEKINKSETINIVVSKGIEKVIVPDMIGKNLEYAQNRIASLGLKLEYTEEFNSAQAGIVFRQDIDADKFIDKGSTVSVVVSKGLEQITVPNITGRTLEEAKTILKDVGLTLTSGIEFSDKIPEDKIISQSIEADQKVDKGSAVPVMVSGGVANIRGNTNANINNGGVAAQQGNWIYYSVHGSIYRIRKDGSENKRLFETENGNNIRNLNVVGEWIYYQSWMDGVYKVKIDGTENKKISSVQVSNLYVVGESIYYTTNDIEGTIDGHIFSMKTDGTNVFNITYDACAYVNIVDDWIYYRCDGLYKIRTDGTQKTLVKSGSANCINVVGNTIYFIDNFSNLKEINLNNISEEKFFEMDVHDINVVGNWIYYLGFDGKFRLSRVKTDGTGQKELTTDEIADYSVVDDWIYYSTQGNGQRYKMRTDGTERQSL